MDGVVVSVAAGARQVFQSKATNPMATALATMLKSKVACATSALADHNGSILMVPWVACDTSVMSTLPPVWLNNHEYQNVTATAPEGNPRGWTAANLPLPGRGGAHASQSR